MGAKTWITLKDSTLRAGSTTTALEAARTAGHTHRALPLPGSTEGLRAAHQGSAHKLKSSTTASCPNPATLLLRYPSINPYSLPYLLPSKLPAHPPFSLLKLPRTAQSTSPECSEEPAALLQAQFGSPFAHSSRVLPMKMSHIKAFLTQHRNKLYTQIKPSLSQNVEKYTVIAEYVVCWLWFDVQTFKDLQFPASAHLGSRENKQQFGAWCETQPAPQPEIKPRDVAHTPKQLQSREILWATFQQLLQI